MAEYLLIAENITYKQHKLSCINIYDRISVIAMPSEFLFDLVAICGPNWPTGEHKLEIKARINTNEEVSVGELKVNIQNENYVYNAIANNLRLILDQSITNVTFIIYDNGNELFSRKYAVEAMFIPQQKANENN